MTDDNKKINLHERDLNLLGKIMFTAIGAWLVGKATNIKLRGSQEEIQTVYNAMVSSRRFQDELHRPGATVDSVMTKLQLKNASSQQFEKILNIAWPL